MFNFQVFKEFFDIVIFQLDSSVVGEHTFYVFGIFWLLFLICVEFIFSWFLINFYFYILALGECCYKLNVCVTWKFIC